MEAQRCPVKIGRKGDNRQQHESWSVDTSGALFPSTENHGRGFLAATRVGMRRSESFAQIRHTSARCRDQKRGKSGYRSGYTGVGWTPTLRQTAVATLAVR
jgi:hypothetical protein